MENSNVLHIPDPSYYPLRLFFFGRSSCQPKHSVASHIRHNYIIHFITGGSGLFSAGQHIYHLHEHQGFLFLRYDYSSLAVNQSTALQGSTWKTVTFCIFLTLRIIFFSLWD